MIDRELTILLAEDNKADQVLTQRLFAQAEINCKLFFANDGIETLDYLRRKGKFNDPKDSPKPDMVLLDIKMPKMNGKEVLKELKSDPALKSIPVIMLTTSNYEDDITESYQFGVNAYITKPVGIDKYINTLNSLKCFWLQVATLPSTVGQKNVF